MSAHGTRSRYVVGCRCRPCTDANTAYQVAWDLRSGRRKYGAKEWERVRPRAQHGTQNMYTRYGCRCLACTDAGVRAANRDFWRGRRRTKTCPRCGRRFLRRGLPIHIGKMHPRLRGWA